MIKYDIQETSLYIPIDTIRGLKKYETTVLKSGPLSVAYQISPILLIYIQMEQECGQAMTRNDFINCANSLITVSTHVTVMNHFNQSNPKYPTREFGIT